MSAAAGGGAASAPRLSFTLPGRWLAADPRDEAVAAARVREMAREVVGSADDAAPARRRLRGELTRVMTAARAAGAHGVFLCLGAASGIATPVALTVHAPEEMRMSPAVGRDADAVLATLRESLAVVGVPGAATAVRCDGPRAHALRIDRSVVESVREDGLTLTRTCLEADYWFAVPGSKRVVLASFSTPLGELREPMLNLFDAVALTASFSLPPSSLRAAGLGGERRG